jgi:retron-type reverse transcriptase
MEDNVISPSLLGIPQGGIASPILFNIYMHEFDKYIVNDLIPSYSTSDPAKNEKKRGLYADIK